MGLLPAHCRRNEREMLVMFEQPLWRAPKITCAVYCVYNPVGETGEAKWIFGGVGWGIPYEPFSDF